MITFQTPKIYKSISRQAGSQLAIREFRTDFSSSMFDYILSTHLQNGFHIFSFLSSRCTDSVTVHSSNNFVWCMVSRTLGSVWSVRCPVRSNVLLCCRVRSNRYEVSTVAYAPYFLSRINVACFRYFWYFAYIRFKIFLSVCCSPSLVR